MEAAATRDNSGDLGTEVGGEIGQAAGVTDDAGRLAAVRDASDQVAGAVCGYPGCGRPCAPADGPGRPPAYCDDPAHTRLSAYRRRRELAALTAADGGLETGDGPRRTGAGSVPASRAGARSETR
ncbi:hypothetical protein I6A62_33680, partial [Frankia sp. AgW1.1]|nr:hypothetical protein [Frankia sp. AgW1.1]